MRSGLRTPIAEIPTPDLAVPYAAPKHVNTMAAVQPMVPKNGYKNPSVRAICVQQTETCRGRLRSATRGAWERSRSTNRVDGAIDMKTSANASDGEATAERDIVEQARGLIKSYE
jgi:hypothetical protein